MEYLEQANTQRQKVDYWLPRAGGEMGTNGLMGAGFPFGVMEIFWNYFGNMLVAQHCEYSKCH